MLTLTGLPKTGERTYSTSFFFSIVTKNTTIRPPQQVYSFFLIILFVVCTNAMGVLVASGYYTLSGFFFLKKVRFLNAVGYIQCCRCSACQARKNLKKQTFVHSPNIYVVYEV